LAKEQAKRPHIYELDPLRVCTALGVVAVHVLAFTVHLNPGVAGYQTQSGVMVAFHYTRAVFMFVTAFALVYVYYGRPFSPLQFWKKRAIGVAFPYVVWSVIYVAFTFAFTTGFSSPGAFVSTSFFDVLTGNASYQLYYILLTVQFYLFFPFFLPIMRVLSRHPWITLSVSFVLQLLFFYVDFHFIQTSSSPFWRTVSEYQDRFFLIYQFYFVLGGLVALSFPRIRAALLRYGKLIAVALVLALAGLWAHYALQINVEGEPVGLATSVLQPVMVFYSVVITFFSLWLASRWTNKRAGQRPRGYRIWHTFSDAAFGVYLVHALVLTAVLYKVVPVLPTVWPVAARVFLAWVLTAGGSLGLSVLFVKTPILSRLVGRNAPLRKRPRVVETPVPNALPDNIHIAKDTQIYAHSTRDMVS
jgi:peptidoglycan/LPS O-acetylase OafA/YrhL